MPLFSQLKSRNAHAWLKRHVLDEAAMPNGGLRVHFAIPYRDRQFSGGKGFVKESVAAFCSELGIDEHHVASDREITVDADLPTLFVTLSGPALVQYQAIRQRFTPASAAVGQPVVAEAPKKWLDRALTSCAKPMAGGPAHPFTPSSPDNAHRHMERADQSTPPKTRSRS